jgi:hypothetical protein
MVSVMYICVGGGKRGKAASATFAMSITKIRAAK